MDLSGVCKEDDIVSGRITPTLNVVWWFIQQMHLVYPEGQAVAKKDVLRAWVQTVLNSSPEFGILRSAVSCAGAVLTVWVFFATSYRAVVDVFSCRASPT